MKNSEKYKEYKKQYDLEYRNKNKTYAYFRTTKSNLYRKYDKETAETMLLCYLLKQKAKGCDIEPFLEKIKYCA